MTMSKIINFIKKRWIWILAVLLLFAVIVSSIEIYKEEVLNIDPDIKYKQKSTLLPARSFPCCHL